MKPCAVSHSKVGDSICSSQQLSSLSWLVVPGTCPAPWTGPEGTSCKRRTSSVHQLSSSGQVILWVPPEDRQTWGRGRRQAVSPSQPSHAAVAAHGGEPCSALSLCDSPGAPLMSCTLKSSPSPADASAHQHRERASPFFLPLLFLLCRCRKWCPALPCTSPS